MNINDGIMLRKRSFIDTIIKIYVRYKTTAA